MAHKKRNPAPNHQAMLFHPLVWGTMLIYLANNAVLQRWMPSQITGKVSDFAWLFFAPIVAYVFVETLVLPRPVPKWMAAFIWGATGMGFALIKISPIANHVLNKGLGHLLGVPVSIVADPSDAIALLALAASLYFFRAYKPKHKRSTPAIPFVAMAVAALLTLADTPAPDYGIACLSINDKAIIASSVYASYISQDGGETWREYEGNTPRCWYNPTEKKASELLKGDGVYIRFGPGQPIQISTDLNSGEWHVEYAFTPATEAQRAYYLKYHAGLPVMLQGPLDALIDPNTGNVIFAMGHEGVLIRKANGTWKWVAVGPYHRLDYRGLKLYKLLWGEAILAVCAGLLSLVGFWGRAAAPQKKWKRVGTVVLIVIAWMLLVVSMFLFPPAMVYGGDAGPLSGFLVMITAIVTAAASGVIIISRKLYLRKTLFLSGLAAAALFFVPYVLWVENILRHYSLASVLSFVLLVGSTVWRYWKTKAA